MNKKFQNKDFLKAIRTLSLPLVISDEKDLINNMTSKQKKRLNDAVLEIKKVISEAWHGGTPKKKLNVGKELVKRLKNFNKNIDKYMTKK